MATDDPLARLAFMRELLTWAEANIRHDPASPAAKDAAERINAAYFALQKGMEEETIVWGAVVGLLECIARDVTPIDVAIAQLIELEPRLDRDLAATAAEAWQADHGKWDATLALLSKAGIYKNEKRHLAAPPAQYLRQRWAQLRRMDVPLAFRPPGWGA